PRAEAVADVIQDPGGLSAAIWILHLASVGLAAGLTVQAVLQLGMGAASGAGTFVVAALLLLISQTLGRAVGGVRPELVATRLYGLVRSIAFVTSVLVRLDNLLVRGILLRLMGRVPEERSATTEEDLRALV